MGLGPIEPPLLPSILLNAAQPSDYEVIAGDLYEEYIVRLHSGGRAKADRWYWSQVIRSMPSLLSYSRSRSTPAGIVTTAAIVLGLLFAMLLVKELIDSGIHAVYHPARGVVHLWPYFPADWLVAAVFGALIVAIIRPHEIRIAILASFMLIGAFTLPIIAGFSAPLPPLTWLLLLGAAPAMTAGGLAYQLVRKIRSNVR
ncbi:MAG: hypothetical protein M3126_12605 [Candidatus Eremiobacteraeota bacterium]|nr:hypothetical protein [Candidatus Eremiobacteraeota bacterium]